GDPMSHGAYPIDLVRQQFPALRRTHNGRPVAYFDGPGGSQVVGTCIDAMADYMRKGGANLHGQFASSVETEAHIHEAKLAMADLLNAGVGELAFGANATTLLFHAARAIGRHWKPGDEIVVTELDHRGNVDPWITQAQDKGVTVRWIKVDTASLTLDLSDLDAVINEKTVLVAVGLASNAVGTVNDVARVAAKAHQAGALVAVDAVQAVPHLSVDFQALGADILSCSAYKFFGPHIGIVAIRRALFEKLEVYRLVPAPSEAPDKLETGTLNHEGIAGLRPSVEFIAALGEGATRRERIVSGYERMEAHENRLAGKIRAALSDLPRVRLYQAAPGVRKTPTVALTVEGLAPSEVCRRIIDEASVFVADGNFYAWTLAEKLGINPAGAWVRAGLSPYNTEEEVDRFIAAMTRLAK
ncbi:MAG TPA: cysteine desulfurase-like protein, partial [Holophaga sp.]|nr:cysteine desulfurase-like protein [Holophaga sp.]